MSVHSKAISSSLVKGNDEAEGVEFLEAAAASSMRFWVEASFFRYLSRLTTKSVMPSWCMTEMSSARFSVRDFVCPGTRVGSTEDPKVRFNFLVDTFCFAV